MPHESIAGLVKDLTTQLSAIAVEFGTRADRLAGAAGGTGEAQAVVTPLNGRELAKQLLAQRQARFDHFPAELFHEPAWDMLLALYIAHDEGRVLNVKSLVACADAPVTTSQRWIEHLHKLRLVTRVVDTIDRRRLEVSLSQNGVEAMETYLSALP